MATSTITPNLTISPDQISIRPKTTPCAVASAVHASAVCDTDKMFRLHGKMIPPVYKADVSALAKGRKTANHTDGETTLSPVANNSTILQKLSASRTARGARSNGQTFYTKHLWYEKLLGVFRTRKGSFKPYFDKIESAPTAAHSNEVPEIPTIVVSVYDEDNVEHGSTDTKADYDLNEELSAVLDAIIGATLKDVEAVPDTRKDNVASMALTDDGTQLAMLKHETPNACELDNFEHGSAKGKADRDAAADVAAVLNTIIETTIEAVETARGARKDSVTSMSAVDDDSHRALVKSEPSDASGPSSVTNTVPIQQADDQAFEGVDSSASTVGIDNILETSMTSHDDTQLLNKCELNGDHCVAGDESVQADDAHNLAGYTKDSEPDLLAARSAHGFAEPPAEEEVRRISAESDSAVDDSCGPHASSARTALSSHGDEHNAYLGAISNSQCQLSDIESTLLTTSHDFSGSSDEDSHLWSSSNSQDGSHYAASTPTEHCTESEQDSVKGLEAPVKVLDGSIAEQTTVENIYSVKSAERIRFPCDSPTVCDDDDDDTYSSLVPQNPPGWSGPASSASDFILGTGRSRRFRPLPPSPYDTTGTRARLLAVKAEMIAERQAAHWATLSRVSHQPDKFVVQPGPITGTAGVELSTFAEPQTSVEAPESSVGPTETDCRDIAKATDALEKDVPSIAKDSTINSGEMSTAMESISEHSVASSSGDNNINQEPMAAQEHPINKANSMSYETLSVAESAHTSGSVIFGHEDAAPTKEPFTTDWNVLLVQAASGIQVHWTLWAMAYITKWETEERIQLAISALEGKVGYADMVTKLGGSQVYTHRHHLPADIIEVDGRNGA